MCTDLKYDISYPTELFDNPLVVVSKIATTFGNEVVNRLPNRGIGKWFEESFSQFYYFSSFTLTDLQHVIYIAVGLTILRYILNFVLLKQIPKWVKMANESAVKFPESSFNASMYAFAWIWELYIVTNNSKNLFYDLATHWTGWERGRAVEPDIYWLYMFQLGFYSHFLFATIFINTKRKDFWVLLLHHFLTLALTSWSYAVRYHYVGLIVLFLHDIGDVFLETAKTLKYFEILDGKRNKFMDLLANIAFGIFTLEWIVCRLYWYPMKVLQSSGVVSMVVCPSGAFYLPFNIMLILLYLMQVYWFYFILKLLYKVLIKGESVDDNREFDVQEKWRKKKEGKKE